MGSHLSEEFLQDPDFSTLEDAYRGLPTKGKIILSCRFQELPGTLKNMEAVSFVGMSINTGGFKKSRVEVIAYKAKVGPCYDTGRKVAYGGAALAALDDDNHLVFGELRICEKTANVYRLPPYKNIMKVSKGEEKLLARLKDDPIPFDCNTYEEDFARLLKMVPGPSRIDTESDRIPLFYPGPFKLLILKDGSLIRRGQTTLTAKCEAVPLIQKDGCIDVGHIEEQKPAPIQNLKEAYGKSGSACLLGDLPIHNTFIHKSTRDFTVLPAVNKGMKKKLLELIKKEGKYFVLTGTNPSDPHGCCPSLDVGIALKLVDAGILSSFGSPTPPDGCPITIFAFAGEITIKDREPRFKINSELRGKVLNHLENPERKVKGVRLEKN